jgi:hypothetical protein
LSKKDAFLLYLKRGGFPFLYNYELDDSDTKQYLSDIFDSIALKDIMQRYKVRDISIGESASDQEGLAGEPVIEHLALVLVALDGSVVGLGIPLNVPGVSVDGSHVWHVSCYGHHDPLANLGLFESGAAQERAIMVGDASKILTDGD